MDKIILVSIPRCGSTWLFHSLNESPHSDTTPKNKYDVISGVEVPYSVRNDYKIYKTHLPYSFWEKNINSNDYVILLVGDVIESVISTKLKRFDKRHFINCGYFGEPKNIFEEDFLGYENIFDSWTKSGLKNLKILKYEKLDFDGLKDFLPFNTKLNPFILRKKSNVNKITKDELLKLKTTYQRLINKVNVI